MRCDGVTVYQEYFEVVKARNPPGKVIGKSYDDAELATKAIARTMSEEKIAG